jgi:hypothetical protein
LKIAPSSTLGALGGGAFASEDSLVFFLNDTFTGNSAELGGGIFNVDAEIGVSNCTFSANLAGGGADIATEGLGETVANSTIFANNTAAFSARAARLRQVDEALSLIDIEGDAAGCFDITNAIVGNQIPTPGHGVRRGVRR